MTREEKTILLYFVDYMESHGHQATEVSLTFSKEEVKKLNDNSSTNIKQEMIEESLKKLLSHEYLKLTTIGGGQFSNLQITSKGVGLVNSIRKKEEELNNRSFLKKSSDYIENHKGVFVFVTAVIGLITAISKLVHCGE